MLATMLSLGPATHAAGDSKAILVLHTYGHDAPGRFPFDTAFARTLREASGASVDLYVETLDPNRFGEQRRLIRDYLRDKYAGKSIAVVVAVYTPALDFLLGGDDPLFPGVPVAATLTRHPNSLPPHVAFRWSGNGIGETLALALKLQPNAQRIVVIDGVPARSARDLGQEIRNQIASIQPRQPVTFFDDLPLDDLLSRVRALPPDTIILLTRQFIGRSNKPIAHADVVKELSAAAPAPVYVTTDQMIGSGAVGGVVVHIDDVGTQLARLALRVAETGSADIPPSEDPLIPTFDWRVLRRWGITESRLPHGSVVLHRQLSLWDQYKAYVVVAVALLSVQSALIAGLIVQGARRARSERALRDSERQLRQSFDLNRDLGGRLINAQEAERTRIARDLHDDVSQQLAGVSIAFSGLKKRLGVYQVSEEVQQELADLQQQTHTLGRNVRQLSHDLHPSVLRHLGLVKGLTGFCAELQRAHGVAMTCRAEGDFSAVAPEAALCVYRIAQEALRNVIAHAGASHAEVVLVQFGRQVEISITDDGRGFDAAGLRERDKGLGLVSIGERAKILGGSISIETGVNKGTRVRARIPMDAHMPTDRDLTVEGAIS